MNLPEGTKYATVNPDGSHTLIFDGKTKWVYSECVTCSKGELIEILYSEGNVCGLKFIKQEPDQVPSGMLAELKSSRQDACDKWNSNWDQAEPVVDSKA